MSGDHGRGAHLDALAVVRAVAVGDAAAVKVLARHADLSALILRLAAFAVEWAGEPARPDVLAFLAAETDRFVARSLDE